MKIICRRNFIGMLLTATLLGTTSLFAASKTEEALIADMGSPKDTVVVSALAAWEKQFPDSKAAFPTMKKLLADPRDKVRRKAARVFAILHADADATDIKNICALLKATDSLEQIDGLKALRDLKATTAVADVLPLLKSSTPNVIRDACRTLAVIGNKDVIPSIEPLTKHSDAKVKADAEIAIAQLNAKS
jgi:HEAT repeat protein